MRIAKVIPLALLLIGCADKPTSVQIAECEILQMNNFKALQDHFLAENLAYACYTSKGYIWDQQRSFCDGQSRQNSSCYVEDNIYTRNIRPIIVKR
jgi:hypothetical protein